MARPGSPLWELTLARLREFYREPGAVFWTFGFPVLLAIGLGIAFRAQPVDKPRVAIVDEPASAWIAHAIAADDSVLASSLTADEAADQLRIGAVDVVVRADPKAVPLGLPRVVPLQGLPRVVYRLDPTRESSRAARLAIDTALQKGLGRSDVVSSSEQAVTEPGARYIDFLMPGLIGLNLMGSSMWGIGYAVVWDRKRRLLKRYIATPMRRSHYLLSYLLSRLLFMVLEVVALAGFGFLVFGVTLHGSIAGVALVSLLAAFAFSGLSLLVAARAQSIEAASGWMNFAMMPMYVLSGSFFAYTRFPELTHPFIRLLPLTATNDALRAIVNDGAGVASTLPQLTVLAAWAVLTFAVALRWFRWQ
ncbi:MAG: ABC transporter permease [Deltaproteobacteria bacterium]|nr:ABC transporter permease [Deltaproteobacteria bacterium]